MIPDFVACLPCSAIEMNHTRKKENGTYVSIIVKALIFCFLCLVTHKTCLKMENVFVFSIYLPDILVLRNITHSLDCSLVEEILLRSAEAVSKPCFFLRVKFKTVFQGKLTMAFTLAFIGITFLVSVLSATQNYPCNVLFQR